MERFHSLFDALGGPANVARLLNVKTSTASEMKRRGAIPVRYWPDLVRACDEYNVPGINYATLVEMHAEKAA